MGLLTLFAAGFAAWYARHAFIQAKRQADSQEKSLALNSRPFVYMEKFEILSAEANLGCFHIRNIGATPAINIRCQTYAFCAFTPANIDAPPFEGDDIKIAVCPTNVVRKAFAKISFPKDFDEKYDRFLVLSIGIKIVYDSHFGKDIVVQEHRWRDWASKDETLFINTRRGDPEEPSFLDDISDEEWDQWQDENRDDEPRQGALDV